MMPRTSFCVRRGGFTRAREPCVRISSSVRMKYWGQVSQVMATPFFFMDRMMDTDLAVDTWQMWTGAPVSSASIASRMTMISSAMAGRPSRHSFRDTRPSLTARFPAMDVSSQWDRMGIFSRLARMSASRIRSALSTLQPSSDKATAPACFSSSASVSSMPFISRDTAPTG